jgi:hypothetical protein
LEESHHGYSHQVLPVEDVRQSFALLAMSRADSAFKRTICPSPLPPACPVRLPASRPSVRARLPARRPSGTSGVESVHRYRLSCIRSPARARTRMSRHRDHARTGEDSQARHGEVALAAREYAPEAPGWSTPRIQHAARPSLSPSRRHASVRASRRCARRRRWRTARSPASIRGSTRCGYTRTTEPRKGGHPMTLQQLAVAQGQPRARRTPARGRRSGARVPAARVWCVGRCDRCGPTRIRRPRRRLAGRAGREARRRAADSRRVRHPRSPIRSGTRRAPGCPTEPCPSMPPLRPPRCRDSRAPDRPDDRGGCGADRRGASPNVSSPMRGISGRRTRPTASRRR